MKTECNKCHTCNEKTVCTCLMHCTDFEHNLNIVTKSAIVVSVGLGAETLGGKRALNHSRFIFVSMLLLSSMGFCIGCMTLNHGTLSVTSKLSRLWWRRGSEAAQTTAAAAAYNKIQRNYISELCATGSDAAKEKSKPVLITLTQSILCRQQWRTE